MYRKKLPFKEDKNELVKSKGENLVNLHVIQPFEESKAKRGRQLNSKTNNLTEQSSKTSPKAIHMQIQSQSIKSKTNKKNIQKCSRRNNTNKIISKAYEADDFGIEEENEYSDSDSLYENKKRKELCQDDPKFKDNLKYSQIVEIYSSNDNEAGENYEFSDDVNFNYEDLLNNEIEKILIEIYNSNITRNSDNAKKMDLLKYENNRYKEKIFEIPEIKKIRDKFYEFKRNLLGVSNPNEISQTNQSCLRKDKNKSISTDYSNNGSPKLAIKNEITNNSTISNFENVNSSKNSKSPVEFNEPESVCKILLSELYNIKKCLIKSSKDIEKIFRLPFSHLKINNKTISFNLEEMHKEEFFNTLIGDEFISALIAQVKTIFKHIKIEEINLLISKIEEGICSPKKEMTRFSDFLIEKLKSFIESDFLDDEDENLNLNHSNISETELAENLNKLTNDNVRHTCCDKHDDIINIAKNDKNDKSDKHDKNEKDDKKEKNIIYYASCNKKISISMSTQNVNEKPSKIGNDVGLDELLEYIAADENPKKTNKKRNKKKKISKNCTNNANLVNNANSNKKLSSLENNLKNGLAHSTSHSHEFDQEVEMFKNSLKSMNCAGKKIKPNLSQAWLNKILKIVNASQ